MLNKNGWGIVEAILFLLIFVVCLLFSFWGLRKLGLVDENWQFYPSSITKDDNGKNNNKDNKTEEPKKEFKYSDLENDMVTATKKYINDFYNNKLGLDTLNIRVSQLKDNGYLKKLKDNNNKNCSGYVAVYKENEEVIYKPYLKCKKYETSGYEERKDD